MPRWRIFFVPDTRSAESHSSMRRTARVLFGSVLLAGVAFGQPVIDGVVEGAGFTAGQPLGVGSAVSIFGSGLAASVLAGDTVPLSNTIGDTSVTINGIQSPLYFVSPGQVNTQVPWNAIPDGGGPANVDIVVTRANVKSAPKSVAVTSISPAVFAVDALGRRYAIAVNIADGSLAAPDGAIPGLATHPVRTGDVLIVYANGLGPVDIPVANGAPSLDALRTTRTTPVVRIGGQVATVFFSGLSPQFPGINQINVSVPAGVTAGPAVPIQVESGGIVSTNQVVIAVAP